MGGARVYGGFSRMNVWIHEAGNVPANLQVFPLALKVQNEAVHRRTACGGLGFCTDVDIN